MPRNKDIYKKLLDIRRIFNNSIREIENENTCDENKISCAFDTAEIETIGIIDGTQFAKFLLEMRNKLDGKYGNLSYVIGKIIKKLPIYKISSEGKK